MDDLVFYSGVGARDTPQDVMDLMTRLARRQAALGRILRSGRASRGADLAWEAGAGNRKQIFKAEQKQRQGDYPTLEKAYFIASQHHDYWSYMPHVYRELFARNVHIVLGPDLDNPSDHLICWTEDGVFQAKDRTKKTGGTGHTIAVACAYGVPVFNLNNKIHHRYVTETLVAGW